MDQTANLLIEKMINRLFARHNNQQYIKLWNFVAIKKDIWLTASIKFCDTVSGNRFSVKCEEMCWNSR